MRNLIIVILINFLVINTFEAQHILKIDAPNAQKVTGAAYVPNNENIVLLDVEALCFYDVENSDNFTAEWLGMESVEVSAALQAGDDLLYLFDGSSYVQFIPSEGSFQGDWETWTGMPANWRNKLDACVRWSAEEIYFFRKDEFVVFNLDQQDYTKSGSLSDWSGWPATWTKVDAAFQMDDQHIYFLQGDEMLVYDMKAEEFYAPYAFEKKAVPSISVASVSTPRMRTGSSVVPGRKSVNYDEVEEVESVEEEEIEEEVAEEEEVVTPVDEYIDTYEDYTSALENDASDWVAQPLPGLDWLGAGFDILKYDPLEPNNLKSRKKYRSIVVTNSPTRSGNKSQYLEPYGTFFGSASSGKSVDTSAWITSYESFRNSMSIDVGGSVEVPKAAAGSASISHKEINSTSTGSASIYLLNRILRRIHEVDLRLLWKDRKTGQKYKQKLDFEFKDAVAELPMPRNTVTLSSLESVHIKNKKDRLPSNLISLKSKYNLFLNRYGTHYASSVTWGGQYVTRTQIKRRDYEKSKQSETGFKADVQAKVKKADVGMNSAGEMGLGTGSSNNTKNFRKIIYSQGGNGEDDLDKWRDKVDLLPAPVEIGFTSMSDLLLKEFFPNDENIGVKKEILRIMTEHYIVNNYRVPKKSKDDFFRDIPGIEVPSNLSVTNNGGYVMWFTVKYKLDGIWHNKKSGDFSLGFSRNIEVPAGATDVTITAKQTTGEIFTKTFDKPETVCYKCWGTIFETAYAKCDE